MGIDQRSLPTSLAVAPIADATAIRSEPDSKSSQIAIACLSTQNSPSDPDQEAIA